MLSIIVLAIIFLIVLIWYRYYYVPQLQRKRYQAIFTQLGYRVYMRPFSFLGVGFLSEMRRCERQYNDALYNQKNVFPTVDVVIGNAADKVVLVFINPEFIKEMVSAEGITKHQKATLLLRAIKYIFGDGIIFSQGDIWKNKRKIISKAFSFDLLKENIPKISQICDKWMDRFEEQHKIVNGKVQYDLFQLGSRVFGGVMMKCFFGCDRIQQKIKGQQFEEFLIKVISSSTNYVSDPIEIIFGNAAWKYGMTSRIRKIKEETVVFRSIIRDLTAKRKEQVLKGQKHERCTDIIQALYYQKLNNKKEDYEYTDEELIDEFCTFLVAGSETTSHFLMMMVYYVALYPQIQQKLMKQLGEVIKSDEDIVYQNLKKLTYIDWIQFETTRHYGPVNGNFARVATEDHYIGKIPVKKGTLMAMQPMGNHYNPKYFKDPFTFKPERWQNECDNLPPFTFTGFSGGPRTCLGKQLALLESKIGLVKLVLRYSKFSVEKKKLAMKLKFLYEPSQPFNIIFEKKVTN